MKYLKLGILSAVLLYSLSVKSQLNILHCFSDSNVVSYINVAEGRILISNNQLYGMQSQGGTNDSGFIFTSHKDGSGFRYLYHFNLASGYNPEGSLIISGSQLYGITTFGGVDSFGTIFTIDTSGNGFNVLYNFSSPLAFPSYGSLLISGNELFGMTNEGGFDTIHGTIFRIHTDGSDFTELLSFNGNNGQWPEGNSLVISRNKLFGMTYNGGPYNHHSNSSYGVIFTIDTTGNNYADLLNFDDTNGRNPMGDLTVSGSKLFGTALGGAHGLGIIFSLDSNGANFKDIFDFNDTNGSGSLGALTLASGILYGTTPAGGINGGGTIFSIDTNGSNFQNLWNFTSDTAINAFNYPCGFLTLNGGILFGQAGSGGICWGGVYSLSLCQNSFTEPICIATIDTATNKAEVIWGRTNSPSQGGYGFYNIYKDTTAGYAFIHSQPLNVFSEYLDMNSNPSIGPVSYELSTTDSCGESALSLPHTTIYLTTTAGVNSFILNWTPYVGFTPSIYRIFRGPALNAMVQIDSVSSSTLTYTDSFPPVGSFYAVEAVNPSGACIPTTSIRGHRASSAMLSGSFSNGFNTAILSVQHIDNPISNLNIYPNPNNGEFTLEWSMVSGQSSVRISIYDELGQMVYDKSLSNYQPSVNSHQLKLNLESLASGIYTLRMQTNSGSTVRKVVIMRK